MLLLFVRIWLMVTENVKFATVQILLMSEVSLEQQNLKTELERAKDFHARKFSDLTSNFYLMKSALRYYSVKKGMSITSTRVSEDFPVAVTVAGSCLSLLDELDVIETRNESSSADRYPPGDVNLERLQKLEDILVESLEIEGFRSGSKAN